MSQIETIKKLHSQGQFEQAIKGYEELLTTEPNNDEAHFGIAHASSQLKQLDKALKHAKEAVNLTPNSDRYQQFKAQMQLANNEVDEALKTFKRSLQENPNLYYSYIAIGDIYTIKNDSKKAKENYKLALKVNNEGIQAIVKMSKLLLLEGDYQAAANELQQAELQFPNDPTLKLQIGITRLEQGEDGFAELYFKKLLEDQPDHTLARIYLGISMINSDPDKASQIITELVNQKVQLPELMAAMGLINAKVNRHQEAIKYLAPICQSGLAYPSWIMALAESFAANSQPNSAMAALNEVLKRGENPKALMILGQIHQVNENFPLAIKTYQRIKTTAKEYYQALLKQAECHFQSGNYQASIDQADIILKEKPDHNGAIKLKLNALSKMYQIDEALNLIESIDSSKQSQEFNQLMHFYAGLLFDERKQFDQAWEHFSLLERPEPFQIPLLSDDEEQIVQSFPSKPTSTVFKFVLADPATGYHEFLQWALDNNITPLIDRFTAKSRADVFSQQWTVKDLAELTDAQTHLWRKKYTRHLKQLIDENVEDVLDFLPFTPLNVAIVKKIFPQANVLVLIRNFADLRLHNRVFGSYQVHHSRLLKVTNQMVALNPNVSLVDIDAWQSNKGDAPALIKNIFGDQVSEFKLSDVKPLDRLMFPYMHWKNYQQQLNQ